MKNMKRTRQRSDGEQQYLNLERFACMLIVFVRVFVCVPSGGIFGGIFVLQLVLALTALCRRGGSPLRAFTPTVFWLLLCFIIHSWIEYSFVFRREGNVSGFQTGMDLYGAADYRYGFGDKLTLESGTAAMEAITAFVSGPLSLLLAWGIVGQKSWRWTVQIIVCTCQMYGLAWFAAHPFFSVEQISSSDPFLYWVIFVGFNASVDRTRQGKEIASKGMVDSHRFL